MAKVSSMSLPRAMVGPTTTRVRPMATPLASTPSLSAQPTHTAVKQTMMNSAPARWPSHTATTPPRSRELTIAGILTTKW